MRCLELLAPETRCKNYFSDLREELEKRFAKQINGGTFSVILSGNTVGTGPGEIDIVFTPATTPEPAAVRAWQWLGLGWCGRYGGGNRGDKIGK